VPDAKKAQQPERSEEETARRAEAEANGLCA
jgi:hypothetical protein